MSGVGGGGRSGGGGGGGVPGGAGGAVRIRGLSAVRVSVPFRRPFATATGMWLHREAWILRVVDAEGRVGHGEAVLEPSAGEVAETVLAALVREAAADAATGRLPSATELEGHGAPGRALRAAIDAALLDLSAPGPPAAAAPGGPGVSVNGTIGFAGPAAGAEAALQAIEAGFTTLKLKAGAERETDALVARVRAIRAAVGPDVRLRLDVNGAWDLATAEDRLAGVARLDIEYAEQPLPAHEVDGLAELRRRVDVPIAADEGAGSVRAVRALLAADAVDVLVVKPARVGGPAAVAEVAELAAERGVPVVVSTLFETGIGIAAALAAAAALPRVDGGRVGGGGAATGAPDAAARPRTGAAERFAAGARPNGLAHGLATAGLLEHDLLVEGFHVADGRMTVPGGPGSRGLGVAVDEGVVARFTTEAIEAAR